MSGETSLGLRPLTDVELGFLRTVRNYGGTVIMAFLKMNKDAAALDLSDAEEAEALQRRIRKVINNASLSRYLQIYVQGKVLIISRPPGAEALVLTEEQKMTLQ